MNINISDEDWEEFKKSVHCPVCLQVFTTPVVLPCQHSLCQKCHEHIVFYNDHPDPTSEEEENSEMEVGSSAAASDEEAEVETQEEAQVETQDDDDDRDPTPEEKIQEVMTLIESALNEANEIRRRRQMEEDDDRPDENNGLIVEADAIQADLNQDQPTEEAAAAPEQGPGQNDDGHEPQPGEGGEPQPGEGGELQPDEGGEPQPDEGGQPQPDEGGEPEPGEGGEPQPGEGGEPQPGEGGEPQPGEGGELQPDEGGEPQPGDGCEPQPDDVGSNQEPVDQTRSVDEAQNENNDGEGDGAEVEPWDAHPDTSLLQITSVRLLMTDPLVHSIDDVSWELVGPRTPDSCHQFRPMIERILALETAEMIEQHQEQQREERRQQRQREREQREQLLQREMEELEQFEREEQERLEREEQVEREWEEQRRELDDGTDDENDVYMLADEVDEVDEEETADEDEGEADEEEDGDAEDGDAEDGDEEDEVTTTADAERREAQQDGGDSLMFPAEDEDADDEASVSDDDAQDDNGQAAAQDADPDYDPTDPAFSPRYMVLDVNNDDAYDDGGDEIEEEPGLQGVPCPVCRNRYRPDEARVNFSLSFYVDFYNTVVNKNEERQRRRSEHLRGVHGGGVQKPKKSRKPNRPGSRRSL